MSSAEYNGWMKLLMKTHARIIGRNCLLLLGLAMALCACQQITPTPAETVVASAVTLPEPSPTPIPTPAHTRTIKPTIRPTTPPTATKKPTKRPTRTPKPTTTPLPPTETPTPLPTETPIPLPTETPIPLPTETPIPLPTETPIPLPTETPIPLPTETPIPLPTETPIPLPTETPLPQPTETPVPLPTETPIPLPTETPIPLPTETPIPLPTETPIPLPTETPLPPPPPLSPTEPPATPTPTPEPCLDPVYPPANEYPLVGLHASADPVISAFERCTFQGLRPSVIKVMTHHPPEHIALLARSQPQASWVVRVQFKFEGRLMNGDEFSTAAIGDTQRTINAIGGRPVIIELYNEPNVAQEGFLHQWQNGTEFQEWWLTALARFRAAFPNVPIIYPGLSPGGDVAGIRQDHTTFIEQSRGAAEASDGLGVHLYWSGSYSLDSALAVLDDYIGRFPGKPIWITETSYNADGISDEERARQYLALIDAVKARPAVRGVIFFVASAYDPTFAPETWVGKNIAPIIGRRDQR